MKALKFTMADSDGTKKTVSISPAVSSVSYSDATFYATKYNAVYGTSFAIVEAAVVDTTETILNPA